MNTWIPAAVTGLGLLVNAVWTILNMQMRAELERQIAEVRAELVKQIAELKESLRDEFIAHEVRGVRMRA